MEEKQLLDEEAMSNQGDPNPEEPEETAGNPDAEQSRPVQVSLDDVIKTTVKALLIREQEKDSQSSVGRGSPKYKNSEISALLPSFPGYRDNVQVWLQRVDVVQDTYKVPDNVMQLIAVGKLTNEALAWYHSKNYLISAPFGVLKDELFDMFYSRTNKVTLMRNFERRRWKKTEKFSAYMVDKISLGNQAGISEADLIDYVIDGFDNPLLQSQARMQEFRTIGDLQRVMKHVTNEDLQGPTTSAPRRVQSGQQNPVTSTPSKRTDATSSSNPVRCYNCGAMGHIASDCRKPKREKGTCYECGSREHLISACPNRRSRAPRGVAPQAEPDSTTNLIESVNVDPYTTTISVSSIDEYGTQCMFKISALIDTGSPISLIKSRYVHPNNFSNNDVSNCYVGVNGSPLVILGIYNTDAIIENKLTNLQLHVVPDNTMRYSALLGRDFLSQSGLCLSVIQGVSTLSSETKIEDECTDFCNQLMLLEPTKGPEINMHVNPDLSQTEQQAVTEMVNDYLHRKPDTELRADIEVSIPVVKGHKPFNFNSRRVSYAEKEQLKHLIDDLLQQGIIRESNSEYASPIVLVKKKTGDLRLCVDYRELNKIVVKDRFPLPLVDDQLDKLKDKKFFTKLDLKSAFHHVKLDDQSAKYTSFVTPLGQFEFTRLPFGYCNSPAIFTRYIHSVFRDLIRQEKISIFIDDILIATDSIEENVYILEQVLNTLAQHSLNLRIDKCSFLMYETTYLGYKITYDGITLSDDHLKAVLNYPIPKNLKEVQSYIGFTSYFRRFVKNYSLIAKPLYDLLKGKREFRFGENEIKSFEKLKESLVQSPILSVYSPLNETELHCDASAMGYGAILMQKQQDGKFHPISYFSKRTTDYESKYHSYELECLSIIYALKRFHVYLYGLAFKIVTDCNSLKLTLNKKEINPRIARWALLLQNYNYILEHRPARNMAHVDALSRCHNVLVLEANSFEQSISLQQMQDITINKLREELESTDHPLYELRNGLVYRKYQDRILFYVPANMETHILKLYHDDMGHLGIDKVREMILRTYWFPNLNTKIKQYANNCLKCIAFSPGSGKNQGFLHSIPKGDRPFEIIHLDHYGPLEKTPQKNKYVFELIDGFTKFVKLYPCKSTNTQELIKHLRRFFADYSKPQKIIADRGSCFTSNDFLEFLAQEDIAIDLIASGCPRGNGQIERINRDITPMLSKLSTDINKWDAVLAKVEFALNNTVNRATKDTASRLLFGIDQRGEVEDPLRTFLENNQDFHRNLEGTRSAAAENIRTLQGYNKEQYDKKRRPAKAYQVGDLVMITNVDTTPGVNKKLIPKYKGPYQIKEVLPSDRYALQDVDGFQITQLPFKGVFDVTRIKPWLRPCESQNLEN